MALRPESAKRSHSVHHLSLQSNNHSSSYPAVLDSPSTEWASQRFGFDHPSPNLARNYLATPESTPIRSRRLSIEKNQRPKLSPSSETSSPSGTFFEYELSQHSRARSPLAPRMLSPNGRDYSFSGIATCPSDSPTHADRRADICIDLDHNGGPIFSPATGVSSSIAVTAAISTTSSAIPALVFSRAARPTHRRITSLEDVKGTPDFTIRKSIPPPIDVPAHNLWSNKTIDLLSSSTSGPPTSSRTRPFLNTFLRVSPSPSPSPDSGANYPELDKTFGIRSLIRRLLFIPFGFLGFLLAPFGSLIIFPDFLHSLTLSKSVSTHSKSRPRRLANLLAVAYVLFSVIMFSQEMFVKIGVMSRKSEEQFKALKVRLVSRKVEELVWVRDWASGTFRKKDNLQASVNEISSSSTDDAVASVPVPWDPQVAVRRKSVEIADPSTDVSSPACQINLNADPLSTFSHPARFAKMHSKLGNEFTSDISPFFFKAADPVESSAVTACMYTNLFWLDELPKFLAEWPGPMSVVVESLAADRVELIAAVERLRLENQTVNAHVDFHLVSSPVIDSRRDAIRQRMLTEPHATNANLNLARFFSRSDLVWLVGDPRVTPGPGLYQHLVEDSTIRNRVLEHGDAIVVPTFGIERTKMAGRVKADSTSLESASQYLEDESASLAIQPSQWPKSKEELVKMASGKISNESPIGLFDKSWEPSKGPTNWALWKTLEGGRLLQRPAEEGGGIGLGVEPDTIGGGVNLYRVSRYELNYAPNVIISREGQNWCTERFEVNKAACIYQMYLSGTELWVTPVGWAITMERMRGEPRRADDAQRLMQSISARLYTKFHQEACMQYGREFLSLGTWDDDRASHLRAMCSKVLMSWGVGAAKAVAH